MEKTYLSISQAGTFQTCAYKWQLKYKLGISRKGSGVSPMSLGSMVHVGLAAALRTMYDFQLWEETIDEDLALDVAYEAIDEWATANMPEQLDIELEGLPPTSIVNDLTAWENMKEDAKTLTELTIREVNIADNYEIVDVYIDGNVVPLIEHWMEVEVPETDFVFRGVVDAVLRNKHDGQIEVVDWKTRGRFLSIENEQLNMQIGVYQYMLWYLYGIEAPVGVVYQIKSTVSKSPEVNKDGTPNKRYANYEYFRPLIVIRNVSIQERLWQNLVAHARRIQAAQQSDEDQPRAFDRSCSWCTFRDICFARLHGYDEQAVIETMYDRKITDEEEEDNG